MQHAIDSRGPRLVPASLVRLRSFLVLHCAGPPVRPWASASDVLDAFHRQLLVRRDDDRYWEDLASLLAAMTADLRRRTALGSKDVVDNELIDPEQIADLLHEIRLALPGSEGDRGGYTRLVSRLGVGPACLALILGAAVTVGCERSTSLRGETDTDTDPAAEVVDSLDPPPDPDPDPHPDPPFDVPCDAHEMDLHEVIDACISDVSYRDIVHTCIDELDESWRSGLSDLFACEDCDKIREYVFTCLFGYTNYCTDPEAAGEFDLEAFLDNCGAYIYLGVRFV